jgi:chemotaxis protein methyltransferase CheR
MDHFNEIGIVDTRNLVKTLNDIHGFDLTNYALTSLKRRFEQVIRLQNLKGTEALILKLSANTEYFDKFLKDFMVETTEMFRDPSLWRWLRDSYFPSIMLPDPRFKIWLPDCVGGDELYSLCIVLKESEFMEKAHITVSSVSKMVNEQIQSGITSTKKLEIGIENYKRYNKFGDISEFFTINEAKAFRSLSLIGQVEFKELSMRKDSLPRQLDMIIYRNHFIYFNQTLQDEITVKLMECLKSGGLLIIGNKEQLGRQFLNDFTLINHSESVYKKR